MNELGLMMTDTPTHFFLTAVALTICSAGRSPIPLTEDDFLERLAHHIEFGISRLDSPSAEQTKFHVEVLLKDLTDTVDYIRQRAENYPA